MSKPNRLAGEKSPYLLQHAYNPVDWYPWGEEAFTKAKELDRPILLSIGYATCHWCHVMEHESFEDEATAELLNNNFIAIKVDREELPDVDHIYMRSLQAMGQQGGWPLNVFLTTDLKPFTGGTYFPPQAMYGRPSFSQILETIAKYWKEERQKLLEPAESLADFISKQEPSTAGDLTEIAPPGLMTSIKAVEELHQSFDQVRGGFLTNGQNKFPPSMALIMLARQYEKNNDSRCLQMLETTLDAMKRGGIYDQIGGGLSRYSTDHDWLVPHFEKMLYDNALFAWALTEAYRVTGDDRYKEWTLDVYSYIFRDMTSPEGAFYSAEDADSDGEEGRFYIWSESGLNETLSETGFSTEQIRTVFQFWGVTSRGNFEGKSILYEPVSREKTRELIDEDLLKKVRKVLLQKRSKRNRPLRDDKILTSWNALMISALSRSGILFADESLTDRAEKAAGFLMEKMKDPDGFYYRRYRDGEAKYRGTLSDHSLLGAAFIDLYRSRPDHNYLREALEINKRIKVYREKDDQGAYFETADKNNLIVRPIDGYDGVIPSGNSATVRFQLMLASLGADREENIKSATGIVNYFKGNLLNYPTAHPFMLYGLFLLHDPPFQLVADSGDDSYKKAARIAFKHSPEPALLKAADADKLKEFTLLSGKKAEPGKEAFFYCHDFVCERPASSAGELSEIIRKG